MSLAAENALAASSSQQSTGWCLSGCLSPGSNLTTLDVTGPTFVLGRRQGVNLQLPSMCVSGRHAELFQVGEHLFIRDLGSTNGTFVNRQQVKQPTPLSPGDHIQIADIEFRIDHLPKSDVFDFSDKKTAHAISILESDWTLSQFDRLISTRAVVPHFQRIVDLDSECIVGFEALARSCLCGLENPARMFETAHLVHREAELSIICRRRAVELAEWMPPDVELFLNTHPTESLEVDVLPSLGVLQHQYPWLSLVVEIHEGSIEDAGRMREFCEEARRFGVKVAYDDFGAGQSRLLELVKAPPDYLKFDACLIRDIHMASAHQQRMLKLLVEMATDVPTVPLAEGIESADEAEACREFGFRLAQGYYFGRPVPGAECAADTERLQKQA